MVRVEKIMQDELEELSLLYYQLANKVSNIDIFKDIFYEIENNRNYFLLGVKIDDRLIGTAMAIVCYDLFFECRPFMIVENVVIDEKFQRKGYGTILFEEIEKIASENNCYYIMLLSHRKRVESHKFYMKLGYSSEDNFAFKRYL